MCEISVAGEHAMSEKSKLLNSREAWKNKAICRVKSLAYSTKEVRRYRKERDQFKKKLFETEAKLKRLESNMQLTRSESKQDIVLLTLQLFLVARIGFRAVAKVLKVLGPYLGILKPPCAQTVINWVTRLSLSRIQYAAELKGSPSAGDIFSNGFIWMIDASVGIGTGKILALLALRVDHHTVNHSAPSFSNVHCIAVSVASSWNGELIAAFLTKVISAIGRPTAFLKDGGSDLGKAVRLLGEAGISCQTIADVSHIVANLFKHAYGEHPLFDSFLSACGKISQNVKQTVLACLAPPKTSVKARFMNLHRLVKWANRMLMHTLPDSPTESLTLKRFREGLDALPEHREYIENFSRDANILLECQKILKNRGLSDPTAAECYARLEGIPADSTIRRGFCTWLKEHLKIAKNIDLLQISLPISSDPIESLYSLAKSHGTGEVLDANRMALRLPALTGPLTLLDAERTLAVTTATQKKIESSLISLTKQRRQTLKFPENLGNLFEPGKQGNLELIPASKNQLKNSNIVDISNGYDFSDGPEICFANCSGFAKYTMNTG